MATVVEGTLGTKRYGERVRRFRQFAWAVLGYNVLVVLWGAYVRASGSGAGCGSHWPLCNGQIVPRAPQVATLIEFSHRITSGLALIAVIGLCIVAFRLFPRGHRERKLAAAAVVFLFIEALLGAGLVLFDYVAQNASVGRAVYLAAHLTNTLLLLGALACTAWFAVTTPIQLRLKEVPWPFWASLPVAVLVCITGSIAALGDTLFPAATLAAGMRQDFSPAANVLVRLRMLHPAVAAVGGLLFATVAFFALRASSRPTMRMLSIVVIVSTFVQLCAGLLNLALLAPIWMQIVHLLLADIVWIALVLFVAEAAVPIQVRFER
ncbi:MAG TPA: COX15/CtaA family protein [Bryobacteraceae bacterium]|nr:COX15/CtaA family protein [Bryobacteraceae bacterium]